MLHSGKSGFLQMVDHFEQLVEEYLLGHVVGENMGNEPEMGELWKMPSEG